MRCPYCGNSSGRTDQRGMCISCGGALETHQEGRVIGYWKGAEYSGRSASLFYALPYPLENPCQVTLDPQRVYK